MFGTWVITSETAAPWIGLAANALRTWDFLVNAINDYRHVKQAEKIIKDSDTDSFVVTRLEIIPHDSFILGLLPMLWGQTAAGHSGLGPLANRIVQRAPSLRARPAVV